MKTFRLSMVILTAFNLLNMLIWAPILFGQPVRERPVERPAEITKRPERVNVTGLTRAQAKAARQAKWALRNARAKQKHREQLRADLQADKTRENRPFPGRRGGIRCRLVWADTAAFEAWQSEFEGIPRIEDRFALRIGNTAYEFPAVYNEDTNELTTPASGRRYTDLQVSLAEIDWLEIQGVTIAQAGTFDPIDLEPIDP